MDILLLVLVFLLIFGFTFGGFWLLSRGTRRVEQRLQDSTASDPSLGSTPELLLGDLTPALAEQIPMADDDRADLQRELRSAGYYRPTALMEYAALRVMLVIVPLLGAGVLALFTEETSTAGWIWFGGIVLAILGYSVPRVYLYYRGQARMHAIERGLPTAIDMLTLCLGAGLNVLLSLRRVAVELQGAYPILASEMEIVSRQAELRSLEFALIQFADRVGLPQVRNISVILTQSENLGTDAVAVLREYADNMRINMRQRADEIANKAPFKLLFPAYMMAFGAGILLISPTVLQFMEFRKNNFIGDTIRESRETLDKAKLTRESIP
jgi:tight adherence protein C